MKTAKSRIEVTRGVCSASAFSILRQQVETWPQFKFASGNPCGASTVSSTEVLWRII
jgi:hypothetical protein